MIFMKLFFENINNTMVVAVNFYGPIFFFRQNINMATNAMMRCGVTSTHKSILLILLARK